MSEFGTDIFVRCVRKLLFYYRLKVVNKISYDITKAKDLFKTLQCFFGDVVHVLETNGASESTSYIRSDIYKIYKWDIFIDISKLNKFLNVKWDSVLTNLDVNSDMMRDLLIDLYYMNGSKELHDGLKMIYSINGVQTILPLEQKSMSKGNALIYPAQFYKKYVISKLDRTHLNKGVIFGSYAKLLEECMEAYYENDMQKYLEEVGDIFITKYHIDTRRQMLQNGCLYPVSRHKLVLFYNFRVSESFREMSAPWLFTDINMVIEMIPCDTWELSYDRNMNDSRDLDSDPYNILMYFKNKIEEEIKI